jgi:hypothetical protein
MDEVEGWKERIRRAPDEELVAFREADFLGLVSLASERWAVVIQAAEDELRRRGLNFH